MNERYGPETRGIIEAINGLKKPAHEQTTYRVVEIDLGVARANVLYELEGWFDFLAVGKLTGEVSIRLNEDTKSSIDLAYVKTIKAPIRRLYITNAAQANCELILGLGGDASIEANPIREGHTVFSYEMLDEDGALNYFETSQDRVVLPTFNLLRRYPADVKQGILMKIMCRLNPTAAVTYRLRLWDAAVNGAATPYLKELTLIYEMDFDAADDTPYMILLRRPFALGIEGEIWYTIQWSGAPGNTPGMIAVEGELYR